MRKEFGAHPFVGLSHLYGTKAVSWVPTREAFSLLWRWRRLSAFSFEVQHERRDIVPY